PARGAQAPDGAVAAGRRPAVRGRDRRRVSRYVDNLVRAMIYLRVGGLPMKDSEKQYTHLEFRPGSNYRTLWIKGRRIRATVVDEHIHGPDPCSPEEFSENFQVPLEAVLEALDYVARNQELVWQERQGEVDRLRARGLIEWPDQG